ncbi:MMPL family transporter [Cellulosimicrobium cellulans]|uniref:MMPL family transporter n=1 Tax=Cellulosimicrobium cellulans TaxID=1710 RepID=UPI00196666D1|nr:MMPL family transporter [Cellulosimicrobium cellulans]MBN0038929.1 MMPL family transporter [Cellulosimicrobium cellulans]
MATFLYRLGLMAARRARLVIGSWVAALVLAVGAYLAFGGTLVGSFEISGTPTAQVTDELQERFAGAGGASGQLVFASSDGSALDQEDEAAIADLMDDVDTIDGVTAVVDPFDAASTAQQQRQRLADGEVELANARDQLDASQAQLDTARTQAEGAGQDPAVAADVAAQQAALDEARAELDAQETTLAQGIALLDLADDITPVSDSREAAIGTIQFDEDPVDDRVLDALATVIEDHAIDGVLVERAGSAAEPPQMSLFGPGEAVGLLVAAVTLFVMLGTFVGAGLPLVNALVGIGTGLAGSLALSGVIEMNTVIPVLGLMLGLAVGIDYSLFILNRHRNQLRDGTALQESIARANGTSGNAVVFAGLTVVIALLALNVTGVAFLGLMGTVAAVCVLIAMAVAVTLTPALLGLLGNRITPAKERRGLRAMKRKALPSTPMSTRRAVITLTAGLGAMLVMAIPALDMRLGLPDGGSEPVDSDAYRAYELVQEQFGAGATSPLLVVADLGAPVDETDLVGTQVRVGQAIAEFDDVSGVAPAGVSEDTQMLAFQVIPTGGANALETEALVNDLRDGSGSLSDVAFGVAGTASANIDISQKLADVLPLYLAVVIGLSLLILVIVFRSILVPVTATIGFLLSVLAAFGGVTAIFQWGWFSDVLGIHNPGPVLSFMPILLVGILFGLAMDYQLFLVSGMREAYAHGVPARLAVQHGMHHGRTVVTAAAIIMISVFGGFVFTHSVMIQTIGFGLAFGVLVDAFIVRMLLIPAVMHVLGKHAWWLPSWLHRILPDVDVEGAKLERERTTFTPSAASVPVA